jgi:hypothetical protein
VIILFTYLEKKFCVFLRVLRETQYEKCQKTKSAYQNLPEVRKAFRVAEKVGESLGGSEILQ